MATLEQYKQFLDAMWISYSTPNPDKRRVWENILAIEAAYARIDKLKWDKALDELLNDVNEGEENGETV